MKSNWIAAEPFGVHIDEFDSAKHQRIKVKKGKGNCMRRKRKKLLEKSNVCFYCGIVLHIDNSTIDHKIPRSKSGTNNIKNLVLACEKCNSEKGDRLMV